LWLPGTQEGVPICLSEERKMPTASELLEWERADVQEFGRAGVRSYAWRRGAWWWGSADRAGESRLLGLHLQDFVDFGKSIGRTIARCSEDSFGLYSKSGWFSMLYEEILTLYPTFSASTARRGLDIDASRLKRLRMRYLIGLMGRGDGRSTERGIRGHCSRSAR
jgi:hypothetical protein